MMKRIFASLIFMCLFCCTPFYITKADDNIDSVIGQSFEYDVILSDLNITINTEDYYVDTFRIFGEVFSINNTFTIELQSYSSPLNYSISCDGHTYYILDYVSENNRESFYFNYITRSYGTAEFFKLGLVYPPYSNYTKGNSLTENMLYFLPDNPTIWDEISSTSQHQKLFPYPDSYSVDKGVYKNLRLDSLYIEENGQASIESYIFTKLDDESITGVINNGYRASFNMTNGVLLGYHYIGYFSGELTGDDVVCYIDFQFELTDYNLSSLSLYTPYDKSNRILIASISLSIMAVAVIIPVTIVSVKRRKIN